MTLFSPEALSASADLNVTQEAGDKVVRALSDAYQKRRTEAAERLRGSLHDAFRLSEDQVVTDVEKVVTHRYENGEKVVASVLARAVIAGTGIDKPFVRFAAIAPQSAQQLPAISERDGEFLDIPEDFETWAMQVAEATPAAT